jgi:hypothetical protein
LSVLGVFKAPLTEELKSKYQADQDNIIPEIPDRFSLLLPATTTSHCGRSDNSRRHRNSNRSTIYRYNRKGSVVANAAAASIRDSKAAAPAPHAKH